MECVDNTSTNIHKVFIGRVSLKQEGTEDPLAAFVVAFADFASYRFG